MKFGEKLRKLRTEKSLTQDEVSKAIGVSRRTYVSYEQDGRYPRKRDVYGKLADVLGCDVNYLMTEDEEFVTSVSEQYGIRGKRQAEELYSIHFFQPSFLRASPHYPSVSATNMFLCSLIIVQTCYFQHFAYGSLP